MTSNADQSCATVRRIADLEHELKELKHLILKERRRSLDIPFPLSTLVVRVRAYLFAVPLEAVEEVSYMVIVQPLPGAPPVIRGMIHYRGRLVPVLDLAVGFSDEPISLSPEVRLVIVSANARLYAIPVDQIHGVCEFDSASVEPMSETTVLPAFVECVLQSDRGAVTLLSAAELLAAGECDLLDEVMAEIPIGDLDAPQ